MTPVQIQMCDNGGEPCTTTPSDSKQHTGYPPTDYTHTDYTPHAPHTAHADYATHAEYTAHASPVLYPQRETQRLLAGPMRACNEQPEEWYLTCPSIGIDFGSFSRALLPIAVLCLLLGVWTDSVGLVLFGCVLCLLATVLCVPLSSIFLVIAVIVFIWTSFGRKAYDIVRYSAVLNSTRLTLRAA